MSQGGIYLLIALLAAHTQQVNTQRAEKTCMAEALYYEARGEGERGQEAVAEVILDRLRSGKHPNSICGVVYEPHQFSFLDDGSMLGKRDQDAWAAANQLAARILSGEIITSMTRQATFYHKATIRPGWAKTLVRTAKIGNHVFYQPR